MSRTGRFTGARWTRSAFVTAWLALHALGCAPLEDDGSSGRGAEPAISGVDGEGSGAASDALEKGLRKDFCCAVKLGNEVQYCVDMHRTKAWAGTKCNVAGGFDSVLRDGKCSKYESCREKEGPCTKNDGLGSRVVPCEAFP